MSKRNQKTVRLAFTGLLAAIIILFTCLPLNISGLEMTLCMLPIAIGAVALGPAPRILCGLCAGLVFKALKNIDKTKFLSYAAGCLVCPLLNTVLFMTSLMLCFGNSDLIQGFMSSLGIFNPLLFVLAFVGIQGLVEAVVNFVLATAVSKAVAAQKLIEI